MPDLDDQDIEAMRNYDRLVATQTARMLRGECPICGERDCGGCDDEDENEDEGSES